MVIYNEFNLQSNKILDSNFDYERKTAYHILPVMQFESLSQLE